MNRRKGFWSLLATAAILGTFGVWIRELDKYFSEFGQVVARSLVATVIILLIIIIKKVKLKVPKDKVRYLVGFTIVFPLSIVCFTYSATSIKVTNALFMLYVGSMISTYLWGRFAFGEKVTGKKIISILLLLVGLVVFVYPFSADTFSTGTVLGIMAGLLEGTAHSFRKFMKDVQRETIVLFQSLSGALIGFLLLLVSGQVFAKEWSTQGILVSVLFGILLVTIGYLLVIGFSNYDVNVGTIILASELFFALVINFIFLREEPTLTEAIGGSIIFLGAIYNNIGRKTHEKITSV